MVSTIFTVPETVIVCNFLIRLFVSFLSKFKFPRDILRSFEANLKAPIIMDIISNLQSLYINLSFLITVDILRLLAKIFRLLSRSFVFFVPNECLAYCMVILCLSLLEHSTIFVIPYFFDEFVFISEFYLSIRIFLCVF